MGKAKEKEPVKRCAWAGDDPLMTAYHDDEWGVPSRDPRHLFEMITLEGAQAGLSWRTVLRKREAYRAAFHGFDVARVARFGEKDVARLLGDAGIVRNRLKVASTIGNAQAVLRLAGEGTSLDELVWRFAPAKSKRPRALGDVPPSTPESDALSRELKKNGFRFVGTTICYAFMQACGLVDDHTQGCFRAKKG